MGYGIMFHHFHDNKQFTEGAGSIDSEMFERIIAYLNEANEILNPMEFINKHRRGELQKNEVCITFDDSLKCQAEIAVPVMEKLGLRGMFFVYNSAFDDKDLNDLEIHRDFKSQYDRWRNLPTLLRTETLYPGIVEQYLDTYDGKYLAEYSFYTEEDRRFRYLRDKICKTIQYNAMIESMMKEKNYSSKTRKRKLFMNKQDIDYLTKKGHIVGLHSETHPTNIDEMTKEEVWSEYMNNFEYVNRLTKVKPIAMSHPLGKYNDQVRKVLKELDLVIGFRDNMEEVDKRSEYEVPRKDHATVVQR